MVTSTPFFVVCKYLQWETMTLSIILEHENLEQKTEATNYFGA